MEDRRDMAMTIMEERIEAGVEMVKKLAEKHNMRFGENFFIKGVEAGISLFIQKETNNRSQKRS